MKAHHDGSSNVRQFRLEHRARQLAVLHENAVRGVCTSAAQLPLDSNLPSGVDSVAACHANQVLAAPDGWGKTALVEQVKAACDNNAWAQPLVVRCTSLNVRGATFRKAIREVLFGLLNALADHNKKVDELLSPIRQALMDLQGRQDTVQKDIVRLSETGLERGHAQSTEERYRERLESRSTRIKDHTTSTTTDTGARIIAPLMAVAQVAASVVSDLNSAADSTVQQSQLSLGRSTAASTVATQTARIKEAFSDVDDLKDRLDRLLDSFRSAILRRQELLKRPTTFLIFDDFDEIPQAAQPFVAEFFRLLAESIGGYIKILGRSHRLNLYIEADAESAGLRPERDVQTIDAYQRALEFEAWEFWLDERIRQVQQFQCFVDGAKEAGHPQMCNEVRGHLALVSGGRPGLFFRLYARANELSWAAFQAGVRDRLVITHADVDASLWALQQLQATSIASAVEQHSTLARVIAFLKASTEQGSFFFETDRYELACSHGLRTAIELLVDQFALMPVGVRADGHGRMSHVYFCDPRTFGPGARDPSVFWREVRDTVANQRWNDAQDKAHLVRLTDHALPARNNVPQRVLPPSATEGA